MRQEVYYREKRLHDEASALNHARREGEAKGRAEGRAEGRAAECHSLIEMMRKKGYSEEQIGDLLGDDI